MIKNKQLIWFKGNVLPVEEAKINVLSPTSQFGANVFEGLRGYWNEERQQLYIFKLNEHISRLQDSIKMMRFEEKFDYNDFRTSILDVVKANNFKEDIAIRQTVFLDGFGSWFSSGPTEMFVAPIAKGRLLKDEIKGVSCCISSWERINDNSISPRIKVGANYINSRAGQQEAKRNGYDFAIFLNHLGGVSEGPGSCLFIIRDNKLITPRISDSVLESITRSSILEIASSELQMEVEERAIDRTELYIADEVFFCGSAVEIVPILSIDKLIVKRGEVGKFTKQLQELYLDIVNGKNEKFTNWLTPVY